MNARQASNALAAIIEGTLLLWVFDPDAIDLEPQIESAARIFLDGLRAGIPAHAR